MWSCRFHRTRPESACPQTNWGEPNAYRLNVADESVARNSMRACVRALYFLGLCACASFFQPLQAQTPSPLQEWQYSGGIILARLFQPNLPRYRTIAGLAAELQPAYDGARAYRVEGGPDFNFYYRDIAFISTGDGIGYNFLRGDQFQVGVAMGYDLGRKVTQDYTNLHGMGDISAAPVGKLYGTWVLSRKFPLILALMRASLSAVRRALWETSRSIHPSQAVPRLRDVRWPFCHARDPPLYAGSLRRDPATIGRLRPSGLQHRARRHPCRGCRLQRHQVYRRALAAELRRGDQCNSRSPSAVR